MLSVFCAPSRYVQGRDATLSLGSEMKKLGLTGQVFILASRSAKKLLERVWAETFRESGSPYSIYDFGGECSRKEIDAAKAKASASGAKVVVGAGGGKVLDAARAVASELDLPIVNCPTLASSDAPCSALSVVYTPDGQFESYIFYKRNPDMVLVDTTVIAMAPPRYLVAGMGDALATWFEAQTVIEAKKKNQLGGATTISAAALAHLCFETLINDGLTALRSVESKVVTPALERLVEANTLLSGLGFESGGLAIAHSVHNGLTTVPQTHRFMHGEKVAFGLLVQLIAEGKPQILIDQIIMFCANVGLPICLADIGIKQLNEEVLRSIAERAAAPGETAHNSPFEVTPRLIADAIVSADALGRPVRGARI
jgi:glycerol dehydrogenase